MGKAKKPRKPKPPVDEQAEPERETQPKSELVPPGRRPPTAVGTETPPPPEPVPSRPRPTPSSRPVLWELLQTLRTAVGAVLDLADAAAEAITKRLEGRA
jgi:hypothetical protein